MEVKCASVAELPEVLFENAGMRLRVFAFAGLVIASELPLKRQLIALSAADRLNGAHPHRVQFHGFS
jgi:hypothetical protein